MANTKEIVILILVVFVGIVLSYIFYSGPFVYFDDNYYIFFSTPNAPRHI